jgi:hypothetical protein
VSALEGAVAKVAVVGITVVAAAAGLVVTLAVRAANRFTRLVTGDDLDGPPDDSEWGAAFPVRRVWDDRTGWREVGE